MSLFTQKATAVVLFHDTALKADLLQYMAPDKRQLVENFVLHYQSAQAGDEVLRAYYLLIAPHEKVFARTHTLVGAAIFLLEGYSSDLGNREQVEAETGAWLVGDDEQADFVHLPKLVQGFVKFYGAEGLSPGLRKEALQKQLKDHQKSHDAMPKETPAHVQSAAQAAHRDLSAECDEAFDAFHDFLDGHFGRKGSAAFNQKKKYAYNRRAGYYHPRESKPAKPPTPPTPPQPNVQPPANPPPANVQPPPAPAPAPGGGQSATPQPANPVTNPVITGAAGSLAAGPSGTSSPGTAAQPPSALPTTPKGP